jgi:phosphatidylserine/phosphatidylglycerophosphate/cardiolipin synthase-like enzyme
LRAPAIIIRMGFSKRKLEQILCFILLVWMSCACSNLGATQTAVPTEIETAETGWYDIYFTKPDDKQAASYRGGPDEPLAKAIEEAHLSVDVAAHQLNLWSLRDALLAAARRGVTVRMVVESDFMDEPEIGQLKEAGILVLGDRRESTMHNKFVIIDRVEVWTGSLNFTVSDVYRNNNNLIRIRSAPIAANYTAEFNEMFEQDLFGDKTLPQTPYPSVTINNTQIEVYFSPDDGTAAEIIRHIQSARESINFLAFSFTSDDIASAMLAKAAEGVSVAGVFESSQVSSNIGGEFELMREAGLDVRLDGNPRNMHHKVIIIDEGTVITGSYNFSANAEKRNDENTLVIHDPAIAAQFMAEFARIFQEAQGNQ